MAELNNLVLVVDLDKTLCAKKLPGESYANVPPHQDIIRAISNVHDSGGEVIIESARNMLTQHNDESKVIKSVGLDTLTWLDKVNMHYDGIKFGKTCGTCYIDDKALRPKEFMSIYNSLKNKKDMVELNKAIESYLETH